MLVLKAVDMQHGRNIRGLVAKYVRHTTATPLSRQHSSSRLPWD